MTDDEQRKRKRFEAQRRRTKYREQGRCILCGKDVADKLEDYCNRHIRSRKKQYRKRYVRIKREKLMAEARKMALADAHHQIECLINAYECNKPTAYDRDAILFALSEAGKEIEQLAEQEGK